MPFRVWATTRSGWFCSQNSRICGSERMMELAAARLRLRPLASTTARRSSRLARTTVSQISAAARRTNPPMNAALAAGCEPSSDRGSTPPEAIPAARASTQARLAATRAMSSRDFPAGRPLAVECIGIRAK